MTISISFGRGDLQFLVKFPDSSKSLQESHVILKFKEGLHQKQPP